MKGRAGVAALALILGACSSQPPEASPNIPLTTHEVQLAEGQTVSLGQNVSVRFVRVAEDSRCAINVQCVWAGNARVVVQVSGTSDSLLNTNTQSGPDALTSGAIRIALVGVDPAPVEPGPPPSTYRIRLRWGFLPD